MDLNRLPPQLLRYRGQVPATDPSIATMIHRRQAAPAAAAVPQVRFRGRQRVQRDTVCRG